ncbi:DinB family protein [Cohnella lubricantis]|uniref:DinB family protein n=1 Tax=Cohnella lubricantis TaxID=2163172 RepID=A0A841TDS1_9BACL|nr:DinB family protein [Cohnella lubricantis]MBB6677127.1 DinB family protein [Cohnella lubricantis]MBP2118974.1 putative damage-inducible protein DinB [Cohnella lubricantis]
MFASIQDFVMEFEMESALTEQTLGALTDESLSQAVASGYRTLGRIAWHLAHSLNFMASLGLKFDEPLVPDQVPDKAADIAAEYRRIRQAFLRAVRSQWTDDTLRESVTILGQEWMNGASLRFVLRHEIHHRGQMTVLMRQAGLRVPNLLGYTRDDWIEIGETPRP